MTDLNLDGLLPELENKFETLEAGIARAVERIGILQTQNMRLETSLREARSKIADLQNSLENYRNQAAEAEKWRQQVQDLTQVKTMVTGKIESLLATINSRMSENP